MGELEFKDKLIKLPFREYTSTAVLSRNAGNLGCRQKATSQATQTSCGVQTTSPSPVGAGLRSHTNTPSMKGGYKNASQKKAGTNAKKVGNAGNPRCRDPATSQATQTSCGVQTNSPSPVGAVLIGPTNNSSLKGDYKNVPQKKVGRGTKKVGNTGNPGCRQKATSQATQTSCGVQTTSPSPLGAGLRSHTSRGSTKIDDKYVASKKARSPSTDTERSRRNRNRQLTILE